MNFNELQAIKKVIKTFTFQQNAVIVACYNMQKLLLLSFMC